MLDHTGRAGYPHRTPPTDHRAGITTPPGESVVIDARPAVPAEESTVVTTVTDLLDFFEKCPRCGYFAQATATVRRYDTGRVDTAIHPSCGLPCGWHGPVRVTTRQRGGVESPRPAR
ncbi:hypothetical protein ACWEKT_00090 [Nocardia takedensis]|uniref:hypothetical protein n=1 Tax=Nocardia takedensis TaxID=259390 RepID=UPI0002F6A167|nr:hypothetical protein [Nocardia takedensis]